MTQPAAGPQVLATVGERAAALLLDLVFLTALALAIAASGVPAAVIWPAVALTYFGVLPATRLQGTLGKWICRIRLCDRAGRRLGWRAAGLRAGAALAWCALAIAANRIEALAAGANGVLFAFMLVFQLPWATMGILPRRESLFDLAAGSLVVRRRADAAAVAAASAVNTRGFRTASSTLAVCLLVAAMVKTYRSACSATRTGARA